MTLENNSLWGMTASTNILQKMLASSLPVLFENGMEIEVTTVTETFLGAIRTPSDAKDCSVRDLMPVIYVNGKDQGCNSLTLEFCHTMQNNVSTLAERIIGTLDRHDTEWKLRYIGWSKAYHEKIRLATREQDVEYVLRCDYSVVPRLYISLSRKDW
jgi:hypothetical protein